jgi:hypothetical protein
VSQSSFLVGMLGVGFLLYLAAKGRLPTYTGVLWGNTAQAPAKSGDGSGGSGSGGSDWVTYAADAAKIAALIV